MPDSLTTATAEGAGRRVKLSDVLYADIVKEIREGRYAQGRLPSEKELALRFGVSRPIVRQTLERLRSEGLVYSRQGIGSFVAGAQDEASGPRQGASAPADDGLFRPMQSISDVQKLYEFRIAVEGEIAYSAAMHRDEADVDKIARALEGLERAIDTGELGAEEDCAFHNAIAASTKSPFFHSVMMVIQPHLRFVIDLSRGLSRLGSVPHLSMIHREHVAILQAIQKHDPDAAREAARAHVSNARERVFNGIVR